MIDGTDLYGIYFINEDKGFAVGQRGRIIQTKDAGGSWEDYAPTYNHIYQIAHTYPHTLYALGEKLHKSPDGGQTWDTLHTGVYNQDRFTYAYKEGHFFSTEEFYVIASAGEVSKVIKSTDGGQNFEIVKSEDKEIRATSIHFLNLQTGYACNSYDSFWSGLHKTRDGGVTWEYLSANRFRDIWFVDENIGFALMGGELYQTNDGGYTWEQTVEVDSDLTKINFTNDAVGYISGTNGLVLKTTDQGINWQELYTGQDDNYGIYFCNQNIGYVTGEYRTLHSTIDGGSTWNSLYFDYGINGEFSDSVQAQPYTLYPNTSQIVSAEIYGLGMDTPYSLRLRAIESESIYFSDTITFTCQTISSTEDIPNTPKVILFPNPAQDILNLVSSEPMESIRIFDISGRILISKTFQSQVDISDLESGPYIINIYNKSGVITGRFLKQ